MNAPNSNQMMRFSMVAIVIAISMMCGSASAASPWFDGYLDPSNSYRYFAHTDWDLSLFGVGIQPDTAVFGIAPPASLVDGHVIYEADGTGSAKVIESTGSFATVPSYMLGSIHTIPSLFADPFFNPGFPPVSDTRGDFSAQFLNIVSGRVGDLNVDGWVDIFDVGIVSDNWDETGEPGIPGDANFDGSVDIFDVGTISDHWSPNTGGASVPEPSSVVLALAGLASLSMLIHRRLP
jgi:hypothetical protein